MRVVIIGCTHAGTAAARQILREHPTTDLIIYERHDNISFLSSGISLYLDHEVDSLDAMFYATPAELTKLGATVKTEHDVLQINAKQRTLRVVDMQTGKVSVDHYDRLIMATGSSVMMPPLQGIDEEHVLLCKDYAQAQRIYATAQDHQRIAIVGAGYVGTELAESYARTDHDVQLFQSRDHILNNYVDPEFSQWAVDKLRDHGVQVYLNHRVRSFSADDNDQIQIETNNGNYSADLVIVCTGFVPNTQMLMGQVKMDRHGALLINDYVQTSDPAIYAAGDCCIVNFNPLEEPAYTPLATNAVRQGALAGKNVFGNQQLYLGTQATSALQLFEECVATTGLTYDHALEHDLPAERVVYQGNWRPDYMPSTDPITIALVYNRETREILGCQLHSRHEITQSANALSIAIQNGNTIDDLAFIDMLYQPNFDEPFNYLNLVAQKAVAQERAAGRDQPRLTVKSHHSN